MRRPLLRPLSAILAVGLAGVSGCGPAESPKTLAVFAAASLRDIAADLAAEFETAEDTEVIFNFAGSNTLAQQIDAAPRADVFLSADERWVDFLAERGRIVADSRHSFLSNRLVAITHRDAALEIHKPTDLARAGYRHLALADPNAVPAGRYARASLESVGWQDSNLWSTVAGRVAPALDVRAALALVESDPGIVGIVYSTDARTSPKVRVLFELPPADDVPIAYSAVLIDGGNVELGRPFLDFLDSPAARAIAERHGFDPVTR